jgi:hypothetical protein
MKASLGYVVRHYLTKTKQKTNPLLERHKVVRTGRSCWSIVLPRIGNGLSLQKICCLAGKIIVSVPGHLSSKLAKIQKLKGKLTELGILGKALGWVGYSRSGG